MKAILLRSAAVITLLTAAAPAQTINWGSEAFSTLVDSHNVELNNSYVFELGAFTTRFDPITSNPLLWIANWRVYDAAEYSQANGYFTARVDMLDNGHSSAPESANIDFRGLDAYLWIRNSNVAENINSEWLLVRSSSWDFPTPSSHCCDPSLPIEWSVSDLTVSDVPVYGAQDGANDTVRKGGGVISTPPPPGTYLQTATLVPELSSSVLIMVLGVLVLLDRRRTWRA